MISRPALEDAYRLGINRLDLSAFSINIKIKKYNF